MKLNLQPLWVFVTAARQESITRAAESLKISQPAASAYIRSLEESLGLRLLERTPRGVRVSPEGAQIFARATQIFAQLEDLEWLAAGQGEPKGTLCICASSTPGAFWLPARLVRFRRCYPGIVPILDLADSARVVEAILKYRCPLGVVGEVPELDASALYTEAVDSDLLALMCPPDNPLAEMKRIHRKSLSSQILIRREPGSSTRRLTDELLGGHVDCFASVIDLSRSEAVRESILAGLGVGVLSSWSAARELEAGRLCRVSDRRFWRRRNFYLVRRADREPQGALRLLWDFLLSPGVP